MYVGPASINGFIPFKNDDMKIGFNPSHGIPDPSKECPVGPDTRTRVKREKAAQSLCFNVAALNIRRYIGPLFCDELKPAFQKFETALVTMEKAQKEHEDEIESCNQIFVSHNNESLRRYTKEKAHVMLQNIAQFMKNADLREQIFKESRAKGEDINEEEMIAQTPGQMRLFAKFLQQDKFANIYDYCLDLKLTPRLKIQLAFLEALGQNQDEIKDDLAPFCDPDKAKEIRAAKDLKSLPAASIGFAVQNAIQLLALYHFRLKVAEWKPDEPFRVLFQQLKSFGPMCFSGKLGYHIYVKKPVLLDEKWEDRPVYGWPPGSKKGEVELISHVVTVVGASHGPEKAGFGFVYFLDPSNPSDPMDPAIDKVYKISYKNLQESARPLSIMRISECANRPSAYAWHRLP